MADAIELHAKARVALVDPAAMLEKVCGHFSEHGSVTRQAGGARLEGAYGSIGIRVEGGALDITVASPNETYLFIVKSSVAEHLFEFAAGEPFTLSWQGDTPAPTQIPYFREAVVRSAHDITPRMRRVVLGCEDTAHFDSDSLHLRVLIPPGGRKPVWPGVGADGRILWPKDEDALIPRVYTIRSIDHARRQLAIDVVLHDDSPGSRWARDARAGAAVGLLGPGGGGIVPADWYLLCGDETALPAIARIAEALPETARARIVIEVADAAEEQAIHSRAAIELTWLHRNGAPPGSTELLPRAVRDIALPDSGELFVLAGCEQAAARLIRKYLRGERKLPRERHLVAAYWRSGHADVHDHGE